MSRISLSRTSKAAGATFALAALMLLCASCKGRTLKDVEATGETVDVVIPEADESAQAQTPAPQADTPAAMETEAPSASDSIRQAPLQFQNY